MRLIFVSRPFYSVGIDTSRESIINNVASATGLNVELEREIAYLHFLSRVFCEVFSDRANGANAELLIIVYTLDERQWVKWYLRSHKSIVNNIADATGLNVELKRKIAYLHFLSRYFGKVSYDRANSVNAERSVSIIVYSSV